MQMMSTELRRRPYQQFLGIVLCGMLVLLTSACGSLVPAETTAEDAPVITHKRQVQLYLPEASGTLVFSGAGVTIDASNVVEGYIMIKSDPSEQLLKLRISCGEEVYGYSLPDDGNYVTYPCQLGSGLYLVRILEQVADQMYAQRFAAELEIEIKNPMGPYLYPSQYVYYDASSEAVKESNKLTESTDDDEVIIQELYRFVAQNTTYDHEKAASVETGYLPIPDETLQSGRGICFDYSALLAVMLRAQGIPTRLVIGVVMPEKVTHAWNQVYINGGWVWMDATFDDETRVQTNYFQERVY